MPFDYKKEYKEFYLPPKKPGIVDIPEMNFIAVRGHGDPNDPEGEYKKAIGLLYGIAFTIKMSYKGTHKMDGYFSYVVPPLEGLWWQAGTPFSLGVGISYAVIRGIPHTSPGGCRDHNLPDHNRNHQHMQEILRPDSFRVCPVCRNTAF